LLANDEDDAVEYKSTARWDIREERRNPALEDEIVKTVAFLNTEGGTLLIGVGPGMGPSSVSNSITHTSSHRTATAWLTGSPVTSPMLSGQPPRCEPARA
jgi:hypothetical protein